MKMLSIDTSTDYLSVAITDGTKVLARYHRPSHRNHSRLLVPTISNLVKNAGLKLKDIDGLCVSVGPGSFTGLRIGVVTVKALAYALDKPVVTVPTLDVIARNAKGFKGVVCPVIDAKKNKVYACLYKSDGVKFKKISKYLLVPVESLLKMTEIYPAAKHPAFQGGIDAGGMSQQQKGAPGFSPGGLHDKVLFLGDGVRLAGRDEKIKNWHPRADVAAGLAAESFRKKKFVSPGKLEPMYIYSMECDIKGR